MPRPEFGKLVRSMRRARMFVDEDQGFRQWTRAHLAERANLTVRQVTRVEQGSVVNLLPLMAGLAAAFELSELERVEFYAQAGYVYSRRLEPPKEPELRSLMAQLPYPVYARTPLWDFVAFNSFSARLWGFDDPVRMQHLREDPLGANFLRTVFDPRFEHELYKGGRAQWEDDAQRCIRGFRASAFPYAHTRRYRLILREMERFPEFRRHWELSERSSGPLGRPTSPMLNVAHPVHGHMRFISTRIPQRYVGDDLELGMYVPLAASAATYEELRRSIPVNDVVFFPDYLSARHDGHPADSVERR